MQVISRVLPLIGSLLFFFSFFPASATDYYFHPRFGNDANSGLSAEQAFQNLEKVKALPLEAGDRILLAGGETFFGSLELIGFRGEKNNPLIIASFGGSETDPILSRINAKGYLNGILLENSSFVKVENLEITAEGYGKHSSVGQMRVGVMIRASQNKGVKGITLNRLILSRIFFENPEVKRSYEETKSANGTQKYGWGIRIINQSQDGIIEDIEILNSQISDLSHTGIKLTGNANHNIRRIAIKGNKVYRTGGPGIQMSGVKFVYVADNEVMYSGSNDDGRKWGRGSGLWTWGSSMVLIERNKFMHANGPGDSAGAHIDFNCDNIVIQYNLSAFNAGGFAEILGNNYNCAYRYNISVNDGHRVKGENGAFQEGKIFWLSGYQGNKKERKGPVNSYFYNNTIYVSEGIVSKIAIDNRSKGILIANNIFHLTGKTELVSGDQYRPDDDSSRRLDDVFFKNNVFLKEGLWPESALIQSDDTLFGDPLFMKPGGLNMVDYTPQNSELVSEGIQIPFLAGDKFGLIEGLQVTKDILGNPISKNPGIGAIQPFSKASESKKEY
ncbi:right-handed parallel beta-helix repeat-containing protein [Algoriphagus namhaensis]